MSGIYDDTYMQDTDVEMYNKACQQGRIDQLLEDAKREASIRVRCYQQGRADKEKEIIEILEDNWLRGTVARRVIDEIIAQIKEKNNDMLHSN